MKRRIKIRSSLGINGQELVFDWVWLLKKIDVKGNSQASVLSNWMGDDDDDLETGNSGRPDFVDKF